jgi:hypothetical protein
VFLMDNESRLDGINVENMVAKMESLYAVLLDGRTGHSHLRTVETCRMPF